MTREMLREDCLRRLARTPWRAVTVVASTASTNDDLRAAASGGALPGRLHLALEQSGGRGRRGRAWHAPEGGIWMSLLLRTREEEASLLGLTGALALLRVARRLGADGAVLKWPNDLLLGGRKAGGVLAQRWSAPAPAANTVLGLGFNLNLSEEDFPPALRSSATSLQLVTGRAAPFAEAAGLVAEEAAALLRELETGRGREIVAEAESRLAWRGAEVTVEDEDGRVERGRIEALTPDGALLLRASGGVERRVHSGLCRRVGAAPFLLVSFLLTLLFLAGGPNARADILHLANGNTVEGTVTECNGGYDVRVGMARFRVGREEVVRWEKRLLPAEEYAARAEATPQSDLDGQYVLALWCQQNGMRDRAEKHFAQVFRLNPNHVQARRAAGYRRVNGEWIALTEEMARKGLVSYDGRWMKAAEAERLRSDDEAKKRVGEIRQSVWEILRPYRTETEEAIFFPERDAATIAELGTPALGALALGSSHYAPRIRFVSLRALARIPGPEAVRLLVERLVRDPAPDLQEEAAAALRNHPDRAAVLRELVARLADAQVAPTRWRLVCGLYLVGDSDAIPSLLALLDHTPTKSGAAPGLPTGADLANAAPLPQTSPKPVPGPDGLPEGDLSPELAAYLGQQGKDGAAPLFKMKTGAAPSAEVYPAHEALVLLTGRDFGRDRAAWEAWWTEAAPDFTLLRPTRDRSGPDEREGKDRSLSLQEQMLRKRRELGWR